MTAYPVLCYATGCNAPASHKVAAGWTDGATSELKTYALACPDCLDSLFAAAKVKCAACRLAPGESLDQPGIYELNRGGRDKTLKRCPELEASLKAAVTS